MTAMMLCETFAERRQRCGEIGDGLSDRIGWVVGVADGPHKVHENEMKMVMTKRC